MIVHTSASLEVLFLTKIFDYWPKSEILSNRKCPTTFPIRPNSLYFKLFSKTIRLQGFDTQTDIHQLAEEIVTKCSLVNPARLPEIEQLLYYLQNRRDGVPDNGLRKEEETAAEVEEASIFELDNYVDLLYEEVADKPEFKNRSLGQISKFLVILAKTVFSPKINISTTIFV